MKKLYLSIFFHFLLFTFHLQAQWTQLPNLPVSGTVYDMYFINANTGWMTLVTPFATLKTTDGGTSWIIQLSGTSLKAGYLQFFNDTTGVALGSDASNITKIITTTNGGTNWNALYTTSDVYQNIYFVNKDTGWACGTDGTFGGVWRTTDGGVNFTRLYTAPTGSLSYLFFLKNKINGEYWGWTLFSTFIFRTSNSGLNWTQIPNNLGSQCSNPSDLYFIDTSNGVAPRGNRCISKTTNGGYNWVNIPEFNALGGKIAMGDSNNAWISISADSIIKTTNFFQTWGKQVLPAIAYRIFAVDTNIVYGGVNQTNMVKTTNGGGSIIYLGIDSGNTTVPSAFTLSQNYPNPFNPQTTIKFSLSKSSFVSLALFDLTGKALLKLYDGEYLATGNYKAVLDMEKLNAASGVYIYELKVSDSKGKQLYSKSKKMVFIK